VLHILLTAVPNRHAFQKILAAHNIGGETPTFSFPTGSRKFNKELCLDPLLKQSDQDSSLMQLDVDLGFLRNERRN
jgi:hypothetical protein